MDPNTGEVAAPTEAEVLNAKVKSLEAELKRIATVRKTQSETLGKFALALSKAQGAMMLAAKDTTNPFFGSKYADLASVVAATQKPLSDNELAIVATVIECSSSKVSVETKMIHSSDEWMATVVTVPITTISKDREKVVVVTAQHIGSALTYCRRYGRQCLTGNAPKDDDDGNAASGKASPERAEGIDREQYMQESPPDDAPPLSTPPSAQPKAETATTGEKLEIEIRFDRLEREIAEATEPAHLKAMTVRISELPESERKSAIRKQWNAKTKELKTPKPSDPGLAPPAFAGENATERAARAASEAYAEQQRTKELGEKHREHPEPGSEG